MRKLVLWVLCCLPFSSFADVDLKPIDKKNVNIWCYNTDKLFETLNKDYNEYPVFMGDTDDVAKSTMSLWISKKGVSWTIVASVDKISCVIGSGSNLKIVSNGKDI